MEQDFRGSRRLHRGGPEGREQELGKIEVGECDSLRGQPRQATKDDFYEINAGLS